MFTVAHSAETAHDLCPHRVVRRDDSRRSTRRLPSLEPRAPITGKATVRRSGSSARPHRETRPGPAAMPGRRTRAGQAWWQASRHDRLVASPSGKLPRKPEARAGTDLGMWDLATVAEAEGDIMILFDPARLRPSLTRPRNRASRGASPARVDSGRREPGSPGSAQLRRAGLGLPPRATCWRWELWRERARGSRSRRHQPAWQGGLCFARSRTLSSLAASCQQS